MNIWWSSFAYAPVPSTLHLSYTLLWQLYVQLKFKISFHYRVVVSMHSTTILYSLNKLYSTLKILIL